MKTAEKVGKYHILCHRLSNNQSISRLCTAHIFSWAHGNTVWHSHHLHIEAETLLRYLDLKIYITLWLPILLDLHLPDNFITLWHEVKFCPPERLSSINHKTNLNQSVRMERWSPASCMHCDYFKLLCVS